MRLEISPEAEADIVRQFRYYLVDQDAPELAVRFRESVIASALQLRRHPRAGVSCSAVEGIRSWPVKGFEAIRIYYQLKDSTLRVVRILHGRRNVREILRRRIER